jgi:hypothetical protein
VLRESAPLANSAQNQAIAVACWIEQRHPILPSGAPNHNIIAIFGLGGLFSVLAYSIYPGTPAQCDAGTAEELGRWPQYKKLDRRSSGLPNG